MKYFINNAEEIYYLKHYFFGIINRIIILRLKLFKLAHGSSIIVDTKNTLQTLYDNTAHLRMTLTIDFRWQKIAHSPQAFETAL